MTSSLCPPINSAIFQAVSTFGHPHARACLMQLWALERLEGSSWAKPRQKIVQYSLAHTDRRALKFRIEHQRIHLLSKGLCLPLDGRLLDGPHTPGLKLNPRNSSIFYRALFAPPRPTVPIERKEDDEHKCRNASRCSAGYGPYWNLRISSHCCTISHRIVCG